MLLFSILLCVARLHAAAPDAARFRGVEYVSLTSLAGPGFLGGTLEMTNWGRNLVLDYDGRRVVFEEGADRLRDADGIVHHLEHPALVMHDDWYVPIEECAAPLGFMRVPGSPKLSWKDRTLELAFEEILPDFQFHQVSSITPIHRPVILAQRLPLSPSLDSVYSVVMQPGSRLLARRQFLLDGERSLIVTTNDESMTSFVCPEASFDQATNADGEFAGSHLDLVLRAAQGLAWCEAGFRHGDRAKLFRRVSLTADLCWSIRPYEKRLYEALAERSAKSGSKPWVTQFVTGRWLQQQPLAMKELLDLEDGGKVRMIWANHSWDHPKSGDFMNAYAPESLRGDTLATEKAMLEWGVIPSIYYRFPGLIHDEQRLQEVADLSLLPVDCDSWVASMRIDGSPTRQLANDGSILLVHGNGNEARGVDRFLDWMEERPDWTFGPLHLFIDPAIALQEGAVESGP